MIMTLEPKTQTIKCNLKRFMDAAALNTAQLSREIDIAENTVRVYSLNRFSRIDCDVAIKLCTYFQVEFGEMFKIVTVNVR